MPRSLRLREQCIPIVKSSLLRNGFPSQKILAEELGISQSTVSSFLNGRPVDYVNFVELCRALSQEWRDIADLDDKSAPEAVPAVKVKVLIRECRQSTSLTAQLQQALSHAGHHVHLAKENTPVTQVLSLSDYWLLLLSQVNVVSEILLEEVRVAKELHAIAPHKPSILPICIDFPSNGHGLTIPLPFDLQEWLQGVQFWQWRCVDDTSYLVSELLNLLQEGRTSLNPQHKLAVHWTPLERKHEGVAIQKMLLANSENLTPQPPSLLGKEESGSPSPPLSFSPTRGEDKGRSLFFTGGVGEGSNPSLIDQQYLHNHDTTGNFPIDLCVSPPLPVATPELPGGQVELASRFYINRPPIEQHCYETISQPGALIRIKAPRQMGKTSLMARLLHHAEQQGSKTVVLSLQLANKRVFASSDTFLQWFCACVGQELGMLEPLMKCWKLAEMIGSNQCCKAYFEQYLLPELSAPLTLGLDEVDRVFESPEIADDFFGLLRALHEEAKRREIWKQFRLVVVHSTEVYIPLDINKSPFNVGLPIELPEFTSEQVQELAQRHGLVWATADVEQLMALVGGHPYLVRVAMYAIARHDVTLSQLLKEASTETGIFTDHLRRHLWNLETYPELLEAMREVVTASTGVRLPSAQAFKLNSMGLVKFQGNDVLPLCQLYERYFCDRLISNV